MCILKTEHLIRNYTMTGASAQTSTIHVLKDIDFEVEKGEFVAIMGKSGCGKSTFLKLLGMIERPTAGAIYFDGMDTEELWKDELADIRRRRIGFVFQDFYLLDSLNVRDNILLPMILDKANSQVMKDKVAELAGRFGIDHLLLKAPYELSGGEKQRAAICRALINDPELILADEPTGNLDSRSGQIVMDALKEINEDMHKTIIMVTHDAVAASYADRAIVFADGRIVADETGPTAERMNQLLMQERERATRQSLTPTGPQSPHAGAGVPLPPRDARNTRTGAHAATAGRHRR